MSDASELSHEHYSVTVAEASHGNNSGGYNRYIQSPYKTEELQQLHNLFSQPDNVKRHYTQSINGQLLLPIMASVQVCDMIHLREPH